MLPDLASRVDFVLVEPSHPGNVGAAARAIRVMGFARLAVVRPHEPSVFEHPQALALASGASDVLAAGRCFDSLEAALGEASLVLGLSAAPREFGPQPLAPRPACAELATELAAGAGRRAALVFGTERSGLTSEQLLHCQRLCIIEGSAGYSSLNLAQAVQVMAFVLREALAGVAAVVQPAGNAALRPAFEGQPATGVQVEALYAHLERALAAIDFLDPDHPKKLMPRLRRLFARTRLEAEEVALLRGICTKMERSAAQARR